MNNYNEDKNIARCPVCQQRVGVVTEGHGMTGTVYVDCGRDERWVARLSCGHLVLVEAYSRGFNRKRDVSCIPLEEFEECRV